MELLILEDKKSLIIPEHNEIPFFFQNLIFSFEDTSFFSNNTYWNLFLKAVLSDYALIKPSFAPKGFFETYRINRIKVKNIIIQHGVSVDTFVTFSDYGHLIDKLFYSSISPYERYMIIFDCYALKHKKLIINNLALSAKSSEIFAQKLRIMNNMGFSFVEIYMGGVNTSPYLFELTHEKISVKITTIC